jgi:hypothetical protein
VKGALADLYGDFPEAAIVIEHLLLAHVWYWPTARD